MRSFFSSKLHYFFLLLFLNFGVLPSPVFTQADDGAGGGGGEVIDDGAAARDNALEGVEPTAEMRERERQAKEEAKEFVSEVLNNCENKLIEANPQCGLQPNDFPAVPGIDPENEDEVAEQEFEEGQQDERRGQLEQCSQAFQACVGEAFTNQNDIITTCRQKLMVFDNGRCISMENASSPVCINFYNTCIDQARWDEAAIAGILAGGANGGAGGSKYPVRMTPEEYRKLNTPIPYCAFTYEGCRDVNDVVTLMVNIGKMIFSIIGVLAFVMFVYGGFTMILAMGNPEKFKKGTSILVAALVGLLIAFSAYLLIDFILDSLGVSANFRGV